MLENNTKARERLVKKCALYTYPYIQISIIEICVINTLGCLTLVSLFFQRSLFSSDIRNKHVNGIYFKELVEKKYLQNG